MHMQTRNTGGVRRTAVVAVTTILLLAGSVILWADNPGPKPDPNVKVESFTPVGTTGPKVNIAIKFSNALVPPDSLDRVSSVIPVTFEPEIAGLARWVSPDMLVVYPDRPLKPATEYRATVHAGGSFVNSNKIREDEHFEFRTSPLSVRVVRDRAQRLRYAPNRLRLILDMEFSYPVDPEALRESLRLEGQKNAAESRLSFVAPDSTLESATASGISHRQLLVTEPFDFNGKEQDYRLVLKKDFKCVSCGEGMQEDFEYIVSVPRNPQTELFVERVNAGKPGKMGNIEIWFSAGIPTSEAKEHISISPPVNFSVEASWRYVALRGDFKPRTDYTITITAGMISSDGLLMNRRFEGKVSMGDMQPNINFTTPGVYMPSGGSRLLEIETTNIDTLSIEIEQIFSNNLVTYFAARADQSSYGWNGRSLYGRKIMVKDFELNGDLNETLQSTIDIGKIIGDTIPGVFAVSARDKSSRWVYDSRHVMLTDIGLTSRLSGEYLAVWINSLSEARPIKKARIKLYSANNQLLLEGKTNSKGVAVFNDIADQVEGFRPYLITVEKDGDLAFLRLDQSRIPISDFDVSGRPYLTSGYEAFVYLDRGVFRPGEKAHIVSILRAQNGVVPPPFPYTIKITDPRGKLFRTYRLNAGELMSELTVDLPPDIPTGRYSVSVLLAENEEMGRSEFLVEEFVPDRIKVTVEPDQETYSSGDMMEIRVVGRMLYGPPAKGHRVSGVVLLRPAAFNPSGYSTYTFADPERTFAEKRIALPDSVLNDSGLIIYHQAIDEELRPPARLTAQIYSTVSEAGGRAVSSSTEVEVHPYDTYLGIKTGLQGYASVDEPVRAHLIAIGRSGTPVTADSVEVRFSRVVYNTMLQTQPDGTYRYVSEKSLEPIDSAWIKVGQGGADLPFTPPDYGSYQIQACDVIGGHVTATQFYASGWGHVPWSMSDPDKLELDLDQKTYRPGAMARLQVRTPFPGRLLLTIENETIQKYMTVDIPENTAELEIPVERDYAPNVYLTGTLIRPSGEIGKHTPARAFGMTPLVVVPENRRIDVELYAPATAQPHDSLEVTIRTDGEGKAQITLAAVDAGVLQLTGFETPDPFEFFCGKRRPALSAYDLYSQIYPELEPASSHLSPPGGANRFSTARHLNPFATRRVNVVSLWTGIVAADSTGSATVKLAIPEFNGQLTLMAVATDGDRFGAQSAGVLVRDKIVIQESFPRFVAPNDLVEGLITLFNGMDSSAVINVSLDVEGAAGLLSPSAQSLRLGANSEGSVVFRVKAAQSPGKVRIGITADGGGERSHSSFEMSNRPGQPLSVKFGSGVVTSDSADSFTLPDDFIAGTDEYTIKTSSMAALRVLKNIDYLLRYPYGCLEQTTSALYPLLYFEDLAKVVAPGLFGSNTNEYYIAVGIERLLRFQLNDGSFSYWPGSKHVSNWSAIYASDFLVEAHNAGYEIESGQYKKMLGFLKDMARGKRFKRITTEQRIYACYALSKAGKLDKKMTNFLMTTGLSDLPAYSRYQIAAAVALAGDVEYARELVPFDVQPETFEPEDGGNFSSGVRTNAILLDLILSVDPQNPSAAALAKSLLNEARLGRWYNTQATSFALVALGKFFQDFETPDFDGRMVIDGIEGFDFDTTDFNLVRDDLGGREVTLSLKGTGPCFYYWQASGVSTSTDIHEFQRGIQISRSYLDKSGRPISLDSVALGDQVIAHIEVEAIGKSLRNVVINDLLPAAFEVENQRLATSASMSWLPDQTATPQYQDIRDDRLLLFVNLAAGKKQDFYYSLRVIAAGEFSVPPVAAECMYNPLIAGAGSSGLLKVHESR